MISSYLPPAITNYMQLNPEETFLLLTCSPYLSENHDSIIRRLADNSLDWSQLLWKSEIFRTTPLINYHINRLELQRFIPEEIMMYLQNWHEISSLRSRLLFRELNIICQAFDNAGIEYFLFKGIVMSSLLYPDPFIRPMLDLDLMVKPQSISTARQIMAELGYCHALWNPDNNSLNVISFEQSGGNDEESYELPAFMKLISVESPVSSEVVPRTWRRKHLKCFVDHNGNISFPLFVDIHFNLSLGFDLQDVWRGAGRDTIFERSVPISSMTTMLWFIASRLYHEAFQFNTYKLIMFGDLNVILRQRYDAIDWEELIMVVRKYGMQPSVFYVLAQLKRIMGANIPDDILSQLLPNQGGIPQMHDWGDVMPKLFSHVVVQEVSFA